MAGVLDNIKGHFRQKNGEVALHLGIAVSI